MYLLALLQAHYSWQASLHVTKVQFLGEKLKIWETDSFCGDWADLQLEAKH